MWAMEIRNIWRPDPARIEAAREALANARWELLVRNPVVVIGTLFLAGLICKRLVGF